ncbi:60S ribosomal export protein NMD3-like [Clavelina lepadiformis]|uniref:60S ribosomal export protein NMD3-like n=1 Tax=Clavelina lepadiformis TaxID=159417 RepID=UPI0040432FBD
METEMENLVPTQTYGMILCCECGREILSNPSNMCVDCLRCKVDITDGIPKHGNLLQCKKCERYLSPPATWISASLESRELLAVCLKRMKTALQRVRLVDASFIWTEPHSKRVKVKITIQKEVDGGTFLEQTFIVEYVVHNHMCTDCHRVEAKDFWNSSVQVRQKATHKKTFYYLEQVILKYKMHQNTTKISERPNGLDFFYSIKQDARKFTDFLTNILPCRYQSSQKLISHDTHSNTYNYKTSFSVELPPVCKDDIVCLPKKIAQQLGNLGQLLICLRVTNCIHLIDFNTLQIAEVSGSFFWRDQFFPICSPKNLVEFTVMEIEPIRNRHTKLGEGTLSSKHTLADCWVIKSNELGMHEDYVHTRTHLGHLLKPGDLVMGLDLKNSNTNNDALGLMKESDLPDVILVRKIFADRQRRRRRRNWKLKHLKGNSKDNDNYMEFLEELEEDKEFRKNIDIYIDGPDVQSSADETEYPTVSLKEMLQDLSLKDDVEMEGE